MYYWLELINWLENLSASLSVRSSFVSCVDQNAPEGNDASEQTDFMIVKDEFDLICKISKEYELE